MGQRPIAVADLGSNTLHLLIAVVEGGRVRELVDESEMLRLSDDVDRTGVISEAKLARVVEVVQRFQHRAVCTGAARLHLLATQAVRQATNRDEVLARVAAITGGPVTVLRPADEVQLAFEGVVRSSRHSPCEAGAGRPYLLVDVGGSSAHLAIGEGDRLVAMRTLPLGSGKLTTLHIVSDPPTAAEMANVKAAAEAALLTLGRDFTDLAPRFAVGAGGSAKAVKRLANLARAGQAIPTERLRAMLETLQRQNATSIANAFEIDRQRARVLPAGITVVERVLTYFGLDEITVKQSGIRDGAVLRLSRGDSVVGTPATTPDPLGASVPANA